MLMIKSTRLQVLLDESELKEIRRAARRRGMTVSEWVRGALREGRRSEPGTAARTKLDVVRAASEHAFPVADVEKAAEVLAGRLRISARDALHVAVMARRQVKRILSFDGGFDGVPGIERIS